MTDSTERDMGLQRDRETNAVPSVEPTRRVPVEPEQAPDAGEQPTASMPPVAPAPQEPVAPVAPWQSTPPWQSKAPQEPVPPQRPAAFQEPVVASDGWARPAPGQPASGQDPYATPSVADATAAPSARRKRLWVPVVSTAAATALLVSLGTVGVMRGLDNDTVVTPSSLATIGRATTDTAPVSGSTADNPNWEKVASAVSASVVAIQVTTTGGGAEGSGVIIDSAGHVLTNNHVVSGADSVQVTLSDGRLYKATIVGTDTTTDLAVVQITNPPKDLSPAALGDSSSVVVGEPVMAVGNPLGLANTVTTGIVSAIDRPVSASAETGTDVVVTNAIQIDAAINPGNSGGPLFDAKGQVVGITSSIATLSGSGSTSGSIGLGFAIPINLAQDIAAQLVKSGTAAHAFLGVSLTDGKATADGTTRLGAEVKDVTSGSPADKAGIKTGDVIVAIDGRPVAGAESLTAYVRERSAGSTAKLTLVRGSNALDVTVTLQAKAATAAPTPSSTQGFGNQNGSNQNPLNPFGNQG